MLNSIIALLLFQTGNWTSIPPIPDARQEVAVVAVEGLVYVIGGIASGGINSSRVDAFDTHSNQWRPVPSVPINVHHPMASAVGHKIYLTGGYTDPGFTAHARTYEFDTQSSTWTRKADMPTAR